MTLQDELAVPPVDMKFSEWLGMTLMLEREAFGQDPVAFEGDRLADFWLAMLHACTEEVTEIGDEMDYKTWISPRGGCNRGAVIKEATDLLHFVALILASVECTGEELTTSYLGTIRKNWARQQAGDDGRSRKCGGCGRSLDDTGVRTVMQDDKPVMTYCNMCGHHIEGDTVEG